MRINEIFHSIQGEGKLVGMPSTFIRTTGCNLRCVWCDTPQTSWEPVGEEMSIDEILSTVASFSSRHVVLTGGEPLIAGGVEDLTRRLVQGGYHITIETAATVWKNLAMDLASISPKLANSTPWDRHEVWAQKHEQARIDIEVIRRFMDSPDYQLKFVINDPEDLDEVETLLASLGDVEPANVLLMPQGVTPKELAPRGEWVSELCKQRGFRYCPRLHIDLYGNRPGT